MRIYISSCKKLKEAHYLKGPHLADLRLEKAQTGKDLHLVLRDLVWPYLLIGCLSTMSSWWHNLLLASYEAIQLLYCQDSPLVAG